MNHDAFSSFQVFAIFFFAWLEFSFFILLLKLSELLHFLFILEVVHQTFLELLLRQTNSLQHCINDTLEALSVFVLLLHAHNFVSLHIVISH